MVVWSVSVLDPDQETVQIKENRKLVQELQELRLYCMVRMHTYCSIIDIGIKNTSQVMEYTPYPLDPLFSLVEMDVQWLKIKKPTRNTAPTIHSFKRRFGQNASVFPGYSE